MAAWHGRLWVTEVSSKYRVHELPAWPFIQGWNPLACYVAHGLSVIQLRINSCMSACVVTYTSHGLLLIKSLLRLAPGRCSIPLVISLVLMVCCFVLKPLFLNKYNFYHHCWISNTACALLYSCVEHYFSFAESTLFLEYLISATTL